MNARKEVKAFLWYLVPYAVIYLASPLLLARAYYAYTDYGRVDWDALVLWIILCALGAALETIVDKELGEKP